MVKVVKFNKQKHTQMLIEMHELHSSPNAEPDCLLYLPKVGYVVLLGNQPVAAGFLRRLEPCFGQFDTFVSNKLFGSQIRHQGLNLVIEMLLMSAKDLKLKGIIALSSDESILNRAQAMGFNVIKQSVIGLLL